MLPNALAIGVSYETFWHLTPKKLNSFYEAYKIKQKMIDEEMWMMGMYIHNAFETVMENFAAGLSGKKGKSKYIQKPILQEMSEKNENTYGESNEECAVFEMKQRIKLLRQQGLPESPI